MDWNEILNQVIKVGIKILISLVVLFISFKIVNWLGRKIEKTAEKKNADKTIVRTLAYVFRIGLKLLIGICVIGYLGIDTSALTALVTSLGVCAGLALNGALANLAGGVLLILTRPFRIDDFIEAEGFSGTVEDIHITNTKLRTPDNKIIYIPNGPLSNSTIVNYSLSDIRRVDAVFSISYESDYGKAKQILSEILNAHELVMKDPEPFIRMSEHSSSSIDITTRVWTKKEDYWTVKFDVLEQVKERFDAEGIQIPYNQLDVHIKND